MKKPKWRKEKPYKVWEITIQLKDMPDRTGPTAEAFLTAKEIKDLYYKNPNCAGLKHSVIEVTEITNRITL